MPRPGPRDEELMRKLVKKQNALVFLNEEVESSLRDLRERANPTLDPMIDELARDAHNLAVQMHKFNEANSAFEQAQKKRLEDSPFSGNHAAKFARELSTEKIMKKEREVLDDLARKLKVKMEKVDQTIEVMEKVDRAARKFYQAWKQVRLKLATVLVAAGVGTMVAPGVGTAIGVIAGTGAVIGSMFAKAARERMGRHIAEAKNEVPARNNRPRRRR